MWLLTSRIGRTFRCNRSTRRLTQREGRASRTRQATVDRIAWMTLRTSPIGEVSAGGACKLSYRATHSLSNWL